GMRFRCSICLSSLALTRAKSQAYMAICLGRVCLHDDDPSRGGELAKVAIEWPQLGTPAGCWRNDLIPACNGGIAKLVASERPKERTGCATVGTLQFTTASQLVH